MQNNKSFSIHTVHEISLIIIQQKAKAETLLVIDYSLLLLASLRLKQHCDRINSNTT